MTSPEELAGLSPRQLFERGKQRGLDHTNSGVDGPALTTAESFWRIGGDHVCPVCRHTFRVGDRVHVQHATAQDTPALVVHASLDLPCTGEVVEDLGDEPRVAAEFFKAIDELNPLKGIATRLKPTSRFVADLPMRVRCAGCGESLRPLEVVVFCPCDETSNKCKLPVHHDPARGLNCRDNWLLNRKVKHCPMSFRKRQG